MRKSRKLKDLLKTDKKNREKSSPQSKDAIAGILEEDLQRLETIFDRSSDIVYRRLQIGGYQNGLVIFLDGFVDKKRLDLDVIKPLTEFENSEETDQIIRLEEMANLIENQVLFTTDKVIKKQKISEVVDRVLAGETAILIDGIKHSFLINTKSLETRSIEEPATERVIRGPRDGFTENLRTNTSLVRRRLKTEKLKMEDMKIGRLSDTNIVITYLDGVVEPSLVEEVRRRLDRIDIDAIEESGYIEELIEDNPYSVFPQVLNTERPDRMAGQDRKSVV